MENSPNTYLKTRNIDISDYVYITRIFDIDGIYQFSFGMEKLNFVKNGELRLPPGFRFHPTDKELVFQYLKGKVFSCPWPASIIPEVEVCKFDPWDLPGDLEQERYFFTSREAKYRNGNKLNRATGSGYWKATGLDKKIVASRGDQVVGMKKILVFHRGKTPHGTRTDWIMHEFRLVFAEDKNNSSQSYEVPVNNGVVLCRIFLKKRDDGKNEEDQVQDRVAKKPRISRPVFYDFMKTTLPQITDHNKPADLIFLG